MRTHHAGRTHETPSSATKRNVSSPLVYIDSESTKKHTYHKLCICPPGEPSPVYYTNFSFFAGTSALPKAPYRKRRTENALPKAPYRKRRTESVIPNVPNRKRRTERDVCGGALANVPNRRRPIESATQNTTNLCSRFALSVLQVGGVDLGISF